MYLCDLGFLIFLAQLPNGVQVLQTCGFVKRDLVERTSNSKSPSGC